MKRVAILMCVASLAACTDAQKAKIGALGDPARITCYSGGNLVFDDFSTGKVSNSESSDGYYFKSETTGELVEMSGDCRIIYSNSRPAGWRPVGVQ